MKIRNKIIAILPVLGSGWQNKNRSKDSEERLAKRVIDMISISSNCETIDSLVYTRAGKVIQKDKSL